MMHSFSAAAQFTTHLLAFRSEPQLQDDRFLARNFSLECTLEDKRVTSYLPSGDLDLGASSHRDQLSRWNQHHDRYLSAQVRAGWRGEELDPMSATAPETFRIRNTLDEYGFTDDAVELVRIESLSRIARIVGEASDDLRRLVDEIATARRSAGSVRRGQRAAELDELLGAWQEASDMDNRPIFACFWEHAGSVLANPSDNWANDLRDRLGLQHLNPVQRLHPDGIHVVAFRYPVNVVHRPDRKGKRPIARPTVLDGPLSSSFCTFPAGSGHGCALDLAGRTEDPWQEVVHPAVMFEAGHVWAVGAITEPSPAELAWPRWAHYDRIQAVVDAEFAALVDEIEDEPS